MRRPVELGFSTVRKNNQEEVLLLRGRQDSADSAYGFLKNPNLKEAATQAVKVMADRLCATQWGPDDDLGIPILII